MKYRVVKEYGLYYPQVRVLFFWWESTTDPAYGEHTLEAAKADIEMHKKLFSKIHKVDVVWRSW